MKIKHTITTMIGMRILSKTPVSHRQFQVARMTLQIHFQTQEAGADVVILQVARLPPTCNQLATNMQLSSIYII